MARHLWTSILVVVASVLLPAQAPETPLADTRLTVHTLLREDVFAGFLQNDVARLARAERNIEQLLATRSDERASLLAWQGVTALTRAVLAHEAGQPAQLQEHYRRARDRFEAAARLGPPSVAVSAITGGAAVSLADRLPAAERAAAWEQAYAAYQQLWTLQGAAIDTLPLHHRGEVLSGLAESAQRRGRDNELAAQLDRILTLLPGTAYATRARQWLDDPSARAQTKLACQTCHGPGTLAARLAEVSTEGR